MPMTSDRAAFFETASIFEENWVKRDTVNALRNHATGVGGGIVVGCDLYNGSITGGVACALTASMEVAGHSGPKVMIMEANDDMA